MCDHAWNFYPFQFKDVSTGLSTPNICGELKKENKSFIPDNLIGPRVFHSPSGKMDISYESDKGQEVDSLSNGETTNQQKSRHVVEIVFTAYSGKNRSGNQCIKVQAIKCML